MHQASRVPDALRPGVSVAPLFRDCRETVQLETWLPGAKIDMRYAGGAELLVIKGNLRSAGEAVVALSWLRLPISAHCLTTASLQGVSVSVSVSVWVRTGHLRSIQAPPVVVDLS